MNRLPPFEKSSLGIDANLAAMLTYVFGFITGILFLVLEKDNKFVRFHAMQSIFVFVTLAVFKFVLGFIPLLGMLIDMFILGPLTLIVWLLLMVKAYQGERFKVPVLGDLAEQQVS
jgi:uncharacterized membrane protein